MDVIFFLSMCKTKTRIPTIDLILRQGRGSRVQKSAVCLLLSWNVSTSQAAKLNELKNEASLQDEIHFVVLTLELRASDGKIQI